MLPHVVVAAVLVVAPAPVSSPRDSAEQAGELYDKGAYLEAAAVASQGYVSPAEATAKRLESARLAQEAFSRAYEATVATGAARPDYLCRALDLLDATAPLAVDEDDVALHKTLTETHIKTLKTGHPDHVCEVGTELRPIIPRARVQASVPSDGPVPIKTVQIGRNRASATFKISGAVAMSFGVAALATMAGGLVFRAQAHKVAIPLADAKQQQDGFFTVEQGRALAGLTQTIHAGRQVAVAGAISGTVLVVLGAALVGWSYTSRARARVSPMVGVGRAGLFVEGRF